MRLSISKISNTNQNSTSSSSSRSRIVSSALALILFILLSNIGQSVELSNKSSHGNNAAAAKRVKPKSYESFCRAYPLHRWCMGAFAGGGKRSLSFSTQPETELDDDPSYVVESGGLAVQLSSDIGDDEYSKSASSAQQSNILEKIIKSLDNDLNDDADTDDNANAETENRNNRLIYWLLKRIEQQQQQQQQRVRYKNNRELLFN